MKNDFYLKLEKKPAGYNADLEECIASLSFDADGLVPVIAQCVETKAVLMLAWMNQEAIRQTLDTGMMTYWSRSREQIWVKGEVSGHFQKFVQMQIDCDGDALLCLVEQTGVACHTGRPDCFYCLVEQKKGQVTIRTESDINVPS